MRRTDCRYATHHLFFLYMAAASAAVMELIDLGYAVGGEETDDGYEVVAYGPENRSLMEIVCQEYKATFGGIEHARVFEWVDFDPGVPAE